MKNAANGKRRTAWRPRAQSIVPDWDGTEAIYDVGKGKRVVGRLKGRGISMAGLKLKLRLTEFWVCLGKVIGVAKRVSKSKR